ncbi:hypothetical protein GIB67_038862 [Kingdonia uniflora]|uniref:Transcription initiation factor TFIID component TAF4 C-terminal domain-containing protein n=1 Tax=Kingdonia uniflora TaxID=39325 RepID=A0A7J7MSH7_9MAGN|nr:hypothetical protein GIB67_038862 [Kingdonia uniflora]
MLYLAVSRCGVKNISNDVEHCVSLGVEERVRGLVSNLIKLSKQRVNIERPSQLLITSDVGRQISLMNRKAKEELDKVQAKEAEKLRKVNKVSVLVQI